MIGLIFHLMVSVACYIYCTFYVWLFHWRKEDEYSIYDLFFRQVYGYSKYDVSAVSFMRWFPVFNLMMVVFATFMIFKCLFDRAHVIEWLKDTKIKKKAAIPETVRSDTADDVFMVI